MDCACMTKWSNQGYLNKLIIISVVLYEINQSGIVRGWQFEI